MGTSADSADLAPAPAAGCRNCGASLNGPFCAACGQKGRLRRSLRGFGGEFASGLFNFEGKVWRTLPLLLWRPGDLTRRFIEGERARFVSPAAMYLFSVFLMFAALSFTGSTDTSAIGRDARESAERKQAVVRSLEGERARRVANRESIAEIDPLLKASRAELETLERLARGRGVVQLDGLSESNLPPWLREPIVRANRNPERAVTSILDASSKYSWLLIPLSLPFLWLLFPFSRRFRMFDHAVFVTYSLSFMMLLVIAGSLLAVGGMPGLIVVLALLPPFHMYRQLRGAYRLGRWSAGLRTLALLIFCLVAIILFALAVVAIGLA